MGSLKARAWWAAATVLPSLVAVHFILVVASLLPAAWLPTAVRRASSGYVAPLFVQNWWLFAPDPPAVDRAAYARGMYWDGAERRTTSWLPLTDPLVEAVRANRLSSQHVTLILVLNATYSVLDAAGPFAAHPEAREQLAAAWSDPARQPSGLVVLESVGYAALAAAYPHHGVDQVQVMIAVRPLPPPAHREGHPELSAFDLVFRPVDARRVADVGLGR